MSTETFNLHTKASDIVGDALEELLSYESYAPEAEDEIHDHLRELVWSACENATIYYSDCADIIANAWGTEISEAEYWLEDNYGNGKLFDGCGTYSEVQNRLAFAILCTMTEPHLAKAVASAVSVYEDEEQDEEESEA